MNQPDLNMPASLTGPALSSKTFRLPAPKSSWASKLFRLGLYTSVFLTVAVLAWLLIFMVMKGLPALSWDMFAWNSTSENHSMLPSILNTLLTVLLTLSLSLFIGIGAAVYLNEYLNPRSPLVKFLMAMTETLAGVPSIVFGLFGMLFFVKALHMQNCLLAGVLTLALMVLPTIIQSTREALLAIPGIYREGSYGLGAGRLRTITHVLLPYALPGILSGVTLSMGRIVGESAALIYTAGTISQLAINPMNSGSTLAVHMYKLLNEGLFMDQAAAVGLVLIVLVLVLNAVGLLAQTWMERKWS